MELLAGEILASWDRQTQILMNLAGRIDDDNKSAKPSADGWSIAGHLAHIHNCRSEWLSHISKPLADSLGEVYQKVDGRWEPISNLEEIRRQLDLSAAAVRQAVAEGFEGGVSRVGPYTHPIMFLQHMLWHEGYHFGLIVLALRINGQEPPEEWEELNVWGIWRDPEI